MKDRRLHSRVQREVIDLIIQHGGATTEGLQLWWGDTDEYRSKSKVIAHMRDEGIIKETKTTFKQRDGYRMSRVYTINKQSARIKDYLREEYCDGTYITYETEVVPPFDAAVRQGNKRIRRTGLAVNVGIMMEKAGVKCGSSCYRNFPLVEGERLDESKSYYYPVYYARVANVDKKFGNRFLGLFSNPDNEDYAVYFPRETRLNWTEKKESEAWNVVIIPILAHFGKARSSYTGEYKRAILICDEKIAVHAITDLKEITRDKKREKEQKKNLNGNIQEESNFVPDDILALPTIYSRGGLLWIPYSEFGVKLIRIMGIKNWKDTVLRKTLGSDYGSMDSRLLVVHDAINRKENMLYFDFCIPDLERFWKFIRNVHTLGETKVGIICYAHQYRFISKFEDGIHEFTYHIVTFTDPNTYLPDKEERDAIRKRNIALKNESKKKYKAWKEEIKKRKRNGEMVDLEEGYKEPEYEIELSPFEVEELTLYHEAIKNENVFHNSDRLKRLGNGSGHNR